MGLGTDLLELSRIHDALDSQDSESKEINGLPPVSHKLVQRVLTAAEIDVFKQRWSTQRARGVAYLATRFAAKEAFSKAMGCGVGRTFSFQDVSVLNGAQGEPVLQYSERLQAWLSDRQWIAHVSLSDQPNYVMATVILSQFNPSSR